MAGKFARILRGIGATAIFALALTGRGEAAGNAAQPPICTRSCWGAQSSSYNTNMAALNRAIIHHTAGAGDYNVSNQAESAAKVRAIQNLHIGNGWGDIGYHFLVDKLGNAFEGRLGSMDKSTQRRGAHDGTNTNSFGFNFPGYYHPPYNNALTAAQKSRMYDVIAWRMPNGWSPYGGSAYGTFGNCGYVDGHRNVKSTSCPGDLVFNTIIGTNWSAGEARNQIMNRINGAAPPPPMGPTVTTLAGWYRMTSKVSGKVVDVAGAGMADGTDVIQYTWTGNSAQVWLFEHLGDGYYKITAKHSGKVLDVEYGSTAAGADIWQWTWNGSNGQQFRVHDSGGGYLTLVARHSGLVMDVAGASTADGGDIIQYTWSGNDAQRFRLESVPVPVTTLSGDYRLIAKHSRKMLDVAGGAMGDQGDVIQYRGNAGDAQVWNFAHVGDGYYTLMCRKSGKLLDVSWGSTADGANVWQYTANGGTAQQWRVEDLGDGHHRLVARHSGKVLDIAGANVNDGGDAIQYTWSGNNAQRWEIERVGQPVTNLSGNKRVVSRVSGKVLDVAGGNTADGTDVIQWAWTGNPAQIWAFTHLGSGFYRLTPQVSGKALNLDGSGLGNGTNVDQWTWNNTDAQKWRVESMPDGSTRLVSAASGNVLDVAGANPADGTDVITWEYTGNIAQQWDIVTVP